MTIHISRSCKDFPPAANLIGNTTNIGHWGLLQSPWDDVSVRRLQVLMGDVRKGISGFPEVATFLYPWFYLVFPSSSHLAMGRWTVSSLVCISPIVCVSNQRQETSSLVTEQCQGYSCVPLCHSSGIPLVIYGVELRVIGLSKGCNWMWETMICSLSSWSLESQAV